MSHIVKSTTILYFGTSDVMYMHVLLLLLLCMNEDLAILMIITSSQPCFFRVCHHMAYMAAMLWASYKVLAIIIMIALLLRCRARVVSFLRRYARCHCSYDVDPAERATPSFFLSLGLARSHGWYIYSSIMVGGWWQVRGVGCVGE